MIAPQDNDPFFAVFVNEPPSPNRLWVSDNGLIASFNTLFAAYPTYWSVHYSPTIDGLISYQLKDKRLHLLDIVASKMPSLDIMLDHLPEESRIFISTLHPIDSPMKQFLSLISMIMIIF